jgi:PAS domain S-box-containing protein
VANQEQHVETAPSQPGAAGDLKESDQMFRTLVAAARDGIWSAAADGSKMLYLNSAVERIYGRSSEEFHQDPNLWFDVIHPDDRARVKESTRDLFKGKWVAIEYRIERPDGEVRWLLDRKSIVTDDDGKPLFMGGIVTDVTERKIAEESLHLSEERFDLAVRGSTDGLWDWNIKSGKVWWSPRFNELLEFEGGANEGCYADFEGLIHTEDKPRVLESIRAHLEDHVPYDIEFRLRTNPGGSCWVRSRGQALWDDSGEPVRMAGSVVDITDRKKLEEEREALELQMRSAQKLESLGLLAGGIAHDFNNILTGILGNAEMATHSLAPGAPILKHLAQIQRGSRRAAELCQQLLAYAGKGRFVLKTFDVSDLIREMAQLLEVSISKKIELRLDFDEDLPMVEGDSSQIRQVIMNLITNASEAIGDAIGVISMRTSVEEVSAGESTMQFGRNRPVGPHICIEVTDTGCGMDVETTNRIFEPFFTTKFAGRGLGLAAVLGIIHAHGGGLQLSSRPGSGTTLKILLPPSGQAREPTAEAERDDDDWRGEGTILVVDDEESVRALVMSILERLGFEVVGAVDGVDALEIFRRRSREIRAVMLDLIMPRMNGQECLRELRRLNPGISVVLASGYSALSPAEIGSKTSFVQKPFLQSELVAKMREVLER